MATDIDVKSISAEAAADLSEKQYLFARMTSSGVNVCTDGDSAIGVIYDNGADAAGKATRIAYSGVVKVIAGGSITKGDKIACNSAGKAVTADSNDCVLGTAMTSGSTNGHVEVLFAVQGRLT